MADTKPLSKRMTTRVLKRLGVQSDTPADLKTLRKLIHQYTRNIPWESASRIVRRTQTPQQSQCALFGSSFWDSALTYGTGGTCFESNYAFFSLLLRLGYHGYLTINNMGDTVGCHTAIVICIDDEKFLVDVGLPIFVPLPLRNHETVVVQSDLLRYSVEPIGDKTFTIWRDPHPNRNAFTLIDRPVDDKPYRIATRNDYHPEDGLFLDKVVINKVIAGNLWRFNSRDLPLHMEKFIDGVRHDYALTHDHADQLAQQFKIDRDILAAALEAVGLPSQ
jgi:arylamine N-acetyltransferase